MSNHSRATSTDLIHHSFHAAPEFEAVMPPTHKASTVFFTNVADMRQRNWLRHDDYSYGLHGTPTTFHLQARLATLEGGKHCLLAPSGLSALSMVHLALLTTGDEVLIPINAYGPTRDLAEHLLQNFAISYRLYDPMSPEPLAFSACTRLLWLEAAGSVTMEFPHLASLIQQARAHNIITALDNTWGAGLAFSPFAVANQQGGHEAVDISVHALTKYPSGGADVLMGSVVTRDDSLHQRLKRVHGQLGLGVGANDVELVLRSLPSLALRYQAQDQSARQLATWLQQQPAVAQVLHPALASGIGHDYWQQTCGDQALAAGLFSIIFQPHYPQAAIDAFCDYLRLFRLGYSWGGPVSLVMLYEPNQLRAEWPDYLVKGSVVRFSIGLEDVADLQADLAQALTVFEDQQQAFW